MRKCSLKVNDMRGYFCLLIQRPLCSWPVLKIYNAIASIYINANFASPTTLNCIECSSTPFLSTRASGLIRARVLCTPRCATPAGVALPGLATLGTWYSGKKKASSLQDKSVIATWTQEQITYMYCKISLEI